MRLILTLLTWLLMVSTEVAAMGNNKHDNAACPAPGTAAGQVVINEVNQEDAWIELFNAGVSTVDLGGWRLQLEAQSSSDFDFVFCQGDCHLGPGQFAIVSTSAAADYIDALKGTGIPVYDNQRLTMHQTIQEVVLFDNNNQLAHYLRYGNNVNAGGRWTYDDCDAAYSSEVYGAGAGDNNNICTNVDGLINVDDDIDGADADDWRNWGSCAITPGASNDEDSNHTQIHHYEIVHDGSGLTCAPETITIKACVDDLDNCTLSSGNETLALTVTGASSSSADVTLDNGSGQLQFYHRTVENVVLALPGVTAPVQCVNANSSRCDMAFSDAGFRFLYGDHNSATVATQVAGAEFNDPLKLQAVKDSNGVCTGVFNGQVSVQMAVQSRLPGAASPLSFTVVDAGGTTTTLSNNATGAVNLYTAVELDFGDDSIALIDHPVYEDAGQILLHARYDSGDFHVAGASAPFWVRPAALQLSATANGGAIDGNSAAHGTTHKAGQPFTLAVSAVNARSVVTPNYQPGQLQLMVTRTGPTLAGSEGELRYTDTQTLSSHLAASADYVSVSHHFLNGVWSYANAAYDEVGLIRLDARDNNYHGENIPAPAIDIGRFVPHHFTRVSGALAGACGAHAYMGEPFSVNLRLEARNADEGITRNYLDAVDADEDYGRASVSWVAENNHDGIDLGGRLSSLGGVWDAGVMHIVAAPVFERASLNTLGINGGPYDQLTVGIRLFDGDGGADIGLSNDLNMNADDVGVVNALDPGRCRVAGHCNALAFNPQITPDPGQPMNTAFAPYQFRFGRMVVNNAFGPETQPLALPLEAQYWNGERFMLNTLDSCSHYQGRVEPATASSATTVTGLAPQPALGPVMLAPLHQGLGQFFFSTPSQTGAVEVTSPQPGWLQYDWDGDGMLDDHPWGVATFGQYRGNDRVISWREVH